MVLDLFIHLQLISQYYNCIFRLNKFLTFQFGVPLKDDLYNDKYLEFIDKSTGADLVKKLFEMQNIKTPKAKIELQQNRTIQFQLMYQPELASQY